MSRPPFIAVDWGTSNRRAWLVAPGGEATATERSDRGVLEVASAGWEGEIAGLRARLGDHPVLMAGMVGSTRGWREAPYVPVPADLAAVAANLLWIEPGRTAIVPGLSFADETHADVMRGEEVQLLGAVAAGSVPADALVCQPGTHNKWATIEGGRITRFVTAMPGELFALLRDHSILSDLLRGATAPDAAFLEGAARGPGELIADLFGARAAVLLGRRGREESASYVSGLLIGADVAPRLASASGPVYVVADAALGALYRAAIVRLGGSAEIVASEAAFLAGITRIGDHVL